MLLFRKTVVFVWALALFAATVGISLGTSEEQKKAEGVPQFVDGTLTFSYQRAQDAIAPSHFDVRLQAVMFIPANTRVTTKYRASFSNNWFATETFGPFPKGQTVTYRHTWQNLDASRWNGRPFEVNVIASTTSGAVPFHRDTVLRRP